MAAITMKFSQAVIDQDHALALQNQASNSLAELFNDINKYGQSLNVGQAVSSTLDGPTLTVRYASGATETYKNVVLDNPGGASGHGSANDYELLQSGVAGMYGTGKINFDYKVEGANTWLFVDARGCVRHPGGRHRPHDRQPRL